MTFIGNAENTIEIEVKMYEGVLHIDQSPSNKHSLHFLFGKNELIFQHCYKSKISDRYDTILATIYSFNKKVH